MRISLDSGKPLRILQSISNAGFYGAERMVLTLASGLQAAGHEVALALFDHHNAASAEVAQQARTNVRTVYVLPCAGRIDFGTVRHFRRLIRAGSYDVFHTHGYKANLYGALAAFGIRVPRVSTCHAWLDDNRLVSLYGSLDRFFLRRVNFIAAVSEERRDQLLRAGMDSAKVAVVPNGIDCDLFAAGHPSLRSELCSANAPIIGYVGRLSPEKAVDVLLWAFSQLPPSDPAPVLAICGDGPEDDRLQQLSATLGISKRTVFCGKRHDMPDVYASLDVLALPSYDEGLPMTLLEALAAGRAVVASDVGGVPGVIQHEITGLLVKPGDVAALADGLRRLVCDRCLRTQLGHAGQNLVRSQFSTEAMLAGYLAIYRSLAEPGR